MSWLSRIIGPKPNRRDTGGSQGLDAQTLVQMAKAGADLSKPTEVINYLYLPVQASAEAAGNELRSAGFDVTVRPAAKGSDWLALAKIQLVPNQPNIKLLRDRFEELAVRFGGEFDGWEAAITK